MHFINLIISANGTRSHGGSEGSGYRLSLASSRRCWEFRRLQGLSRCWCLWSLCWVALGCPSSSLGAEGGIRGCHPHHPIPEPLPAPLPGPCRQGRDGLAAFTTLLSSRPKMAGGPRACRGEAQRPKFRWVSTSRWLQRLRGSWGGRRAGSLLPSSRPIRRLTAGCTKLCTKLDFGAIWVYNPWRKDSGLGRDHS